MNNNNKMLLLENNKIIKIYYYLDEIYFVNLKNVFGIKIINYKAFIK